MSKTLNLSLLDIVDSSLVTWTCFDLELAQNEIFNYDYFGMGLDDKIFKSPPKHIPSFPVKVEEEEVEAETSEDSVVIMP